MKIPINFGDNTVSVTVPDHKPVTVLQPESCEPLPEPLLSIRQALASPEGTRPLTEMIGQENSIAIVVDDISRPVPTSKILTVLFELFESMQVDLAGVTVIVALGVHRAMHPSELDTLLGTYKGRVKIINHDPDDDGNLVEVGETSFQNRVRLNRLFCEAGIRILTGDIEYHQFCGYGGGAKSVFPGIADRESIQRNHARQFLPGAEQGELAGNPVRQEIEEVAEMVRIDFILNVVLNQDYKITGVFAGDVKQAFQKGTDLVNKIYKKSLAEPVDLVLTSPGGYPKDIDLYQSQKAVKAAARIVKKGGVIVLFAECRDGHGSQLFYESVKQAGSLQEIVDKHKRGFVLGAHKAFQYARDMLHADVCLYSSLPDALISEFFLKPVTLDEVNNLLNSGDRIAVLPNASATHVVLD
jgi:nickel-dependent lactate racemase